VVPEEQAGADPQEIQAQEVPEAEEQARNSRSAWTTSLVHSKEVNPGVF
jgi:hypothetical protein